MNTSPTGLFPSFGHNVIARYEIHFSGVDFVNPALNFSSPQPIMLFA